MPLLHEPPNPNRRQNCKNHRRRPIGNNNQSMIGRNPRPLGIRGPELMKCAVKLRISLPHVSQMPLHLYRISRHPPVPNGIWGEPILAMMKTSRRMAIQIADDVKPAANRLNQVPIASRRDIARDVANPVASNPYRCRRHKQQQRHPADDCEHNTPHNWSSYRQDGRHLPTKGPFVGLIERLTGSGFADRVDAL
jgi:hypothetical protein